VNSSSFDGVLVYFFSVTDDHRSTTKDEKILCAWCNMLWDFKKAYCNFFSGSLRDHAIFFSAHL